MDIKEDNANLVEFQLEKLVIVSACVIRIIKVIIVKLHFDALMLVERNVRITVL
jgi:hypothetical protein